MISNENFHIRSHKSNITSDYVIGFVQSIYAKDENQLMYFDIKRIHNNSYKYDDDDDDEYYDDFDNNQGCVYYDFKIVEEQEHDEMSSIFERITQEKINLMNYNDVYHVKITHVEIELYKNQIKFVNKYRRVDVYIKANEKHDEWRTIFFNDPENFTNNEIDNINNDINYELLIPKE